MEKTGKPVAWICIFSILFTGCYQATLISPTREIERSDLPEIEYVVTKDGTRYTFSRAPFIADGSLLVQDKRSVSIPLSTVLHFTSMEGTRTTSLDKVHHIVTKDSTRYFFEAPPTMTQDFVIVGVAVRNVTIPLSDISRVSVRQADVVGTVLLVLGVGTLLVGIIVLTGFSETIPPSD